MDVKGKVHEISEVIQVTETFKKRELVIELTESLYPEYIKFEALQDKVSLFDPLQVGDEVEVFFNLRGRAWTDKNGKTAYFNSLIAWRINVLAAGGSEQQHEPPPSFSTIDIGAQSPDEDNDLPF